ncbi:cytochrome P450 [Kineococcus sp. TBRC 1896]|uniref:Cytochrome P450 n=1 Tax=Kineococcus mangrovi TaxID=1660183 RepID=A0ABV4I066_9ACTN
MSTTETPAHPLEASGAFPAARRCPFAPPPEYARWRAEPRLPQVVLPSGKRAWVITRYADARAVLADPRISSDARNPGFPGLGAGEQAVAAELRPFIRMDPPEHTDVRRMLLGEFTVRRSEAREPGIRAVVDEELRRFSTGPRPADLVDGFAAPVATRLILRLLGVPGDDTAFFRGVTAVSGGRNSSAEEVGAALREMFGLLDALVERRTADPGDDLISRLVTGPFARGEISRPSLLSQIGITLNAGHETTRNMIALSVLTLLEHPDQLALLRAEPERWPDAVEELLRHLSVADTVPLRVATADLEVGGRTVRAGDGVVVPLAAANHDPASFDRDDVTAGQFDLRRSPNRHLAFGFGPHQCLGQHLARVELRTALRRLVEELPDLRLARPAADLPLALNSSIFGVDELPVTW